MNENAKEKNTKRPCWIIMPIVGVALSVIVGVLIYKNQPQRVMQNYIDNSNFAEAINYYNEKIVDGKYEEEYNVVFTAKVDEIYSAWVDGTSASDEAIIELEKYLKIEDEEIYAYIHEKIDYIVLETECQEQFVEGKAEFDAGDYVAALQIFTGITDRYSKYGNVVAMVYQCKEAVLEATSAPYTVEEYEKCIKMLNECLTITAERDFIERVEKLEDELNLLKEILAVIQTAADLYDGGYVEEAFFVLSFGLNDYPENERIEEALVNFHNHYLFSIVSQVSNLCDQEQYDEAITLLETAIGEYECEEFTQLLVSVKEQKSVLYRVTNNLVEKFKTFSQKWESEEITVEQLANDAGAYIVKSGEKFMLGDYSEADVTVLSMSGDIVTSVMGVDLLLDLRDLSYDVMNWGEGDHFAVRLATDVVALIPVIGMVKYLDYLKPAAKGANAAAEVVDSVVDVGKDTGKVIDSILATVENSKVLKKITDAIDSAKDAVKTSQIAKQVQKNATKGYELVDTMNKRLVGKIHDVTGVEFSLKRLKYSTGQMIQGVFPKFESFAEVTLKRDLYKASFNDQKEYCLKKLQEMTRPVIGKYRKNFTEEQLEQIAAGVLPDGFTWHHNEEEGLMQLVDTLIHDATAHTGGMSLWGRGYN